MCNFILQLKVKATSPRMLCYLLFFATIVASPLAAQNTFQLPAHPRLLVKQADIPALKRRMEHKDFAFIKKNFVKQKNFKTDGIAIDGEPDESIRQKIENLAFTYLLDTVKEKQAGLEAVRLVNIYLASIKTVKGYHPNAHAYQSVFTGALVYDWCYRLMGNETRQQLITNMKNVSCLAEYCLFKNTPKQYLSGHYGEYAPTVFLAMGLAIYDEQKDVFDFAFKEQVEKFAPSRNPWYASGSHHQGSQYIHVRYGHEILQAFIMEKIGLNPYVKEISTVAYRDIYANIPQAMDMDGMPEGDCHNNITMGNNYLEFIPIAASLSKDPFIQSYAKLNLDKLSDLSTRAFIFYDPEAKVASFDNLSLSRFFSSPSGLMIARTKWDLDKKNFSSNAMVVLMNLREYSTKNHVHLDVGHFGIYYKGHLALDAGIYQGKDPNNEWGKLNYVNYYARTIAHNSLLILDPDEPTPYEGSNVKALSRDGGQFSFKNRAWDSTQEMLAAGKSAQILAQQISQGNAPDYSYLKGDMTRAYNVPTNVAVYPAKVDTVKRSFIFLNLKNDKVPGALIVLDKVVATNKNFKKSWLLHSQNEPFVNKNKITITNTTNGRNGQLVNTVILPEETNQTIDVIGGEGKEYWVDGKNWGTVTQEDAGRYRVELSPKSASKSNVFFNVIQVTDASPSVDVYPVTKALATKGNYMAIALSDRIVAQQLSLNNTDTTITFSIGNKTKAYKVLVTDLATGYWKAVVNNSTINTFLVSTDSGTIYFKSNGGNFKLIYLGKNK